MSNLFDDENDEKDNPTDVHTYPIYGKQHLMRRDCWCNPELEQYTYMLIIHREQN